MDQHVSNSLLADEIKSFQDQLLPTILEETMHTLMNELQGLIASGIAESAVKQQDTFPGFVLPNADNETRALSDFLSRGDRWSSTFTVVPGARTATLKSMRCRKGCTKYRPPAVS